MQNAPNHTARIDGITMNDGHPPWSTTTKSFIRLCEEARSPHSFHFEIHHTGGSLERLFVYIGSRHGADELSLLANKGNLTPHAPLDAGVGNACFGTTVPIGVC